MSHDVIPSFLARRSDSYYDGDVFDNYLLRVGEVVDLILPEDKRNISGKFIEYKVLVQHRANGTAVTKLYDRCVLMNPLGSRADRMFWTLRKDPQAKKDGVGLGSKVLILCVNGESDNPIIIGGIRDKTDKGDKDVKDLGHHFYANFNGVAVSVDKDGQFLISYEGATKNDGTTDVDDKKRGTKMSFLKDGSWNVTTVDGDEHEQFMFLDHADHTTTHQAKKEWLVQVTEGPAKIKSRDGLKVGDATDHMLLGESFRKEQQKMNNQLLSLINTLKGLLTTAGAAITAASAVPSVIGVAPSGFAPAGAALTAAANVAGQMAQTVQAFEQAASAKNSFLSKNNASD